MKVTVVYRIQHTLQFSLLYNYNKIQEVTYKKLHRSEDVTLPIDSLLTSLTIFSAMLFLDTSPNV